MSSKTCSECNSACEVDRQQLAFVRLAVKGVSAFPDVDVHLIVCVAKVIAEIPEANRKHPTALFRRTLKHILAMPVPQYLNLLRKIEGAMQTVAS